MFLQPGARPFPKVRYQTLADVLQTASDPALTTTAVITQADPGPASIITEIDMTESPVEEAERWVTARSEEYIRPEDDGRLYINIGRQDTETTRA